MQTAQGNSPFQSWKYAALHPPSDAERRDLSDKTFGDYLEAIRGGLWSSFFDPGAGIVTDEFARDLRK